MEGAAVHSLQVAWLIAVSFGARAVTLPRTGRQLTSPRPAESPSKMTRSVWLRIDSYTITLICLFVCFSPRTYFNRKSCGGRPFTVLESKMPPPHFHAAGFSARVEQKFATSPGPSTLWVLSNPSQVFICICI